jgi:hypothetical protein
MKSSASLTTESSVLISEARLHEEALIKAFIVKAKHKRMISQLANPKRRDAVLKTFAHFRDLNPRWAHRCAPSLHNPSSIEQLLRSKGAPSLCYAISQDSLMDGRFLSLNEALAAVVGQLGFGTFISSIPGKLGYFEDEDGRFIREKSLRDP